MWCSAGQSSTVQCGVVQYSRKPPRELESFIRELSNVSTEKSKWIQRFALKILGQGGHHSCILPYVALILIPVMLYRKMRVVNNHIKCYKFIAHKRKIKYIYVYLCFRKNLAFQGITVN